jgi:hypothetical protein
MPQEKVSAGNYYRRWLVQIGRQARSDIPALIVGLIIAIAILILQAHNSTVPISDFRANAFSIFWPYLAAIGAYLFYATIRAPFELDRERADDIDGKARTIENLSAKLATPLFSVEFDRLEFGRPLANSSVRMVVHLTIHAGDTPVTLHDWALRSLMKPQLAPRAASVALGPALNGNQIYFQPRESRVGYIAFDFNGVVSATEDEVRDARHEMETPVSRWKRRTVRANPNRDVFPHRGQLARQISTSVDTQMLEGMNLSGGALAV